MSPIPSGPYAISRPQDLLLTLLNGSQGAPVNILSPTGNPGEQEWAVEAKSDGNVTIKNVKYSQYYLSYDKAADGTRVTTQTEPREWQLRQSAEPFKFHVVVPGGPIDGAELVLDISPVKIFPPLAALARIRPDDVNQAWTFQFHE